MIKDLIQKHISNNLNPTDLVLLREAFETKSEDEFCEILAGIWDSIDTEKPNAHYSVLAKLKLKELENRL